MTDAVIVSTARTGLAKSWRGALNMTHGATMGGHVVKHAIERAKIDPAEVDDVIIHEGGGSTMGMDLQMALSNTRGALVAKLVGFLSRWNQEPFW